MKNWKLFYSFQCPLGATDSKIGITGHPAVRLGVYQNGYSRNSHIACFDKVYVGDAKEIGFLEKAAKNQFHWDIQRDGRGVSEWIGNTTTTSVEKMVDELIESYHFKIQKVSRKFLPLTVDNLLEFLEYYKLDKNTK